MTSSHICPCCAHNLLRHVRSRGIYWFCANCHQEMPILGHQFESLKDGVVTAKKLPFPGRFITLSLIGNCLLVTN